MFSSPFFSSILGKRKEESESEASSGEESEEESEKLEDVQVPLDEEEEEDDEDDAPFADSNEVMDGVFDPSTATLSQLLTKIIPDAKIHCPNVIIVGAQSSGKTKMIISMVFHHLIENPSVTDEMGEKLLKIFRTGEKMVTRRPTKIEFVKTEPGTPCNITLALEGLCAEFADPKFAEIIDSVHLESLNRDGKAFGKELVVTIAAPDLPSMTFTDLPGLITDDRAVSDEEGMSIRKLVKKYMRKPASTLVVVEPASTEDFETSQVAPLLKEMRDSDRPHIFNNAVLVLSKCDTIRQGLEGRIMALMDLSSPSIADYPFKHVVGVVNKVESSLRTPTASGVESQSFAEFKQTFRATKEHEKVIFAAYTNLNGTSCNRKTQCTTAAVFHQMDRITFDQVHGSIGRGLDVIHDKVEKIEQQMRDELAPPLSFYDTLLQDKAGRSVFDKSNRRAILRTLRDALKRLVANEFKTLSVYERHPYDVQRIAAGQADFLERIGISWPGEHGLGDMFVSERQSTAVDELRKYFSKFFSRKIVDCMLNVIDDDNIGCLAGIHSRFHRIDRFGLLVDALKDALRAMVPACVQSAKDAVIAYLVHFYDFEVPKGVTKERFGRLVDELHHVAVRKVFESFRAASKGDVLEDLFLQDILFQENPEFVELREELHAKWEKLRQQKWILARCKQVLSNEQLRDTLQEAYEEQRARSPDRGGQHNSSEWQEFWTAAELLERSASRKVRPPPTSMYSRSTSSVEVPAVTSTHASQQEPYSQLEDWPAADSQEPTAAMDIATVPESGSSGTSANLRSDSLQSTSQRADTLGAREPVEREVVREVELSERVQEVQPDQQGKQSSRDSTTPFKRFKASHDETTAAAVPSWNSYDQFSSPNPAVAPSGLVSPSLGAPTFVTGSVFSSMTGIGAGVGSPSRNNGASGIGGYMRNFVNSLTSPPSESHASPKTITNSKLYRPNYTAAQSTPVALAAPPAQNYQSTPQNFIGQNYASTTLASGTINASIVKREVEYTNTRRETAHGSREAKGSPDDMIDLTD